MSRLPLLAQFFERHAMPGVAPVPLGTQTGTASEREVLDSDEGTMLWGDERQRSSTLAKTDTPAVLLGTQTKVKAPHPGRAGDSDVCATGRGFLDARVL